MEKQIDFVEVKPGGIVQVRQLIKEPNQKDKFHRWILIPGQNIDNEDQIVKDFCEKVWTPEIVAEFQTKG